MKTYTKDQNNSYRRFKRAASQAGAVRIQRTSHGCGVFSAQGFDAAGKLVCDWDLSNFPQFKK